MENVYGISPQMKHYGCVVDLLSQSGRLERAYEFILKMPIPADVVLWRILLSACKFHGNITLAETVSKKLLELDAGNSGNYVLISDTCASAGKWDFMLKSSLITGYFSTKILYFDLTKLLDCHLKIMDRSWMYGKRDFVYLERLEEFLSCAVEHQRLHGDNQFVCPCTLCQNRKKVNSRDELREHLILKGFKADYNVWVWYGESVNDICSNVNFGINDKDGDQIDVGVENDDEIFENIDMDDNIELDNDNIDGLMKDLEEDIVECPIIFQRMVDNSKKPLYPNGSKFSLLLAVLKLFTLKAGNGWSDKSFTSLLELLCQMLPEDAEYMWWHQKGRNRDGRLRHVADSPQWRKIDRTFPEFGSEPRNLRLGLCTDGINPFGTLSTQHSCWPVMLVIYNIPPWLTTKSKYIMLTLLISGPKQPGNDIDVYLAPLIEDLKLLWNVGTDKGCLVCGDDIESDWLEHSGKFSYRGGRRFLPENHQYRKKKKAFYGKTEHRKPPLFLSGEEYYDKVKNITTIFGKPYIPPPDGVYHTKRSIFWELPYWQHLYVRHCIDVMHVEKNVFDSLIGTLLNMPNKTKDGVKARNDMAARGRIELKPIEKGKRIYIPPSCTTLSKKEKMIVCESLKGVKVPHGYSSNISRLVSIKDSKLVGMKSHDCHVMLTQLLYVAIRSVLPKHVRQVITKLCLFFDAINSKDIHPDTLDDLQADVVVTLCELEMYFPISFFDIMVHLVIHLVREIKLCGPVFQRNMWAMEREMGTYKRRMMNRCRPEGSIVEATIACETIQFCVDYMADVQPIGFPISRHEGRLLGKGTLGKKQMSVDRDSFQKAHLYVLQHMTEVHPYLTEHLDLLKLQNPHKRDDWLLNEHSRTFAEWFKGKVMSELSTQSHNISANLRWLAYGPKSNITSFEGYDINGFCFYTSRQDEKSTMQNSGVTLLASSEEYVGKGKDPVDITRAYYGKIEDIWELEYVTFSVPLFQCKWVDCDKGVTVDDMGFISVNFNVVGHIHEPFILASQAKQVFYIEDPLDKRSSVVRYGKRRILGVEGVVDEEEYDQLDELASYFVSVDRFKIYVMKVICVKIMMRVYGLIN
ncbi:uncharacterized protein LOC141590091 [Silene latifolia]|uniref:uncharacterized protein LOC141590091 n=1 Tax=Silene latifolia TaxID=37657 RepID=UPI003D7852DE